MDCMNTTFVVDQSPVLHLGLCVSVVGQSWGSEKVDAEDPQRRSLAVTCTLGSLPRLAGRLEIETASPARKGLGDLVPSTLALARGSPLRSLLECGPGSRRRGNRRS